MFNKITFSNKIKAQPMGHNYNQLNMTKAASLRYHLINIP